MKRLKAFTASQKEIMQKLNRLIGSELSYESLKRNILIINLPETERSNDKFSGSMSVQIERLCRDYGFGNVQMSGINALALYI